MVRQPVTDGVKPRVAVIVVERVTGRHLGDVGLRMEIVRVGERDTQTLGQRRPNVDLPDPETPMTTIGDAILPT